MRERERLSQRDVVNAGLDKCDNGRKGEGEKGEHVESVKRGYHNNDKKRRRLLLPGRLRRLPCAAWGHE